jgi:hypothetical protein
MKAFRNSILAHEQQKRNQHTNAKINAKLHVETAVPMH